jgi:hypothetical protein
LLRPGAGQGGMPDVVADAEPWVVGPDGASQLQGHPPHSLPIPGDEVEPRLDGRRELGLRWWGALEQEGGAHMQLLDLALEMEPSGVKGAQTFHDVPDG